MYSTVEQPWYKQFWPWFLITLPSVVIIACLFTAYLAVKNPLSMVKKDYYQEGLTININKAELKQAKSLGLRAHMLFENNHVIQVELNSSTVINYPSTLELNFNHPVDDAKDISLVLTLTRDKTYASELIKSEQWQLLQNEKHWYLQLQSSSKSKVEWILEGQTDHAAVNELTLTPSGP